MNKSWRTSLPYLWCSLVISELQSKASLEQRLTVKGRSHQMKWVNLALTVLSWKRARKSHSVSSYSLATRPRLKSQCNEPEARLTRMFTDLRMCLKCQQHQHSNSLDWLLWGSYSKSSKVPLNSCLWKYRMMRSRTSQVPSLVRKNRSRIDLSLMMSSQISLFMTMITLI